MSSDSAVARAISALPDSLNQSVVRFGPGHEYGWHRDQAEQALAALAAAGGVILGLDFRSDGSGTTAQGYSTEAAIGLNAVLPGSPPEGLHWALDALRTAPWHLLDGYDWVLVTFDPPGDS